MWDRLAAAAVDLVVCHRATNNGEPPRVNIDAVC